MEIGPTPGTSEVHKIDTAPARKQTGNRAPAATPVVDSDRVTTLREAIASGRYQVDPQRIADSLLAQDRAALG